MCRMQWKTNFSIFGSDIKSININTISFSMCYVCLCQLRQFKKLHWSFFTAQQTSFHEFPLMVTSWYFKWVLTVGKIYVWLSYHYHNIRNRVHLQTLLHYTYGDGGNVWSRPSTNNTNYQTYSIPPLFTQRLSVVITTFKYRGIHCWGVWIIAVWHSLKIIIVFLLKQDVRDTRDVYWIKHSKENLIQFIQAVLLKKFWGYVLDPSLFCILDFLCIFHIFEKCACVCMCLYS